MNDDEMDAQMEYWKSKAKAAEAERDEWKTEAMAARQHPHFAALNDQRGRADAAEAERDAAIACLQRVVEADRDDSRMGYPNAGDSCIGACIALDVMPWLDQRGKLLPFVNRADPEDA